MTSPTACSLGVLTSTGTCVANSCQGILAPSHGVLGNCSGTLSSGESCVFQCENGYDLTGPTSCFAGNLTTLGTCNEKTCTLTQIPAHAVSEGTCASGTIVSNCTIECEEGYTVSGPSRCVLGNLTSETCIPNDCVVNFGDCSGLLNHGTTCVPTTGCLNSSYVVSGQFSCSAGRLYVSLFFYSFVESLFLTLEVGQMLEDVSLTHTHSLTHIQSLTYTHRNENATCLEASCTISSSPQNGAMGTCTSNLPSQSSCSFQCDQTYSLTSETVCSFGNLISTGTCVRNCTSTDDTVTNIPFKFLSSNTENIFFNDQQGAAKFLYSSSSIPIQASIPTSSYISSNSISVSFTPKQASTIRTVVHRSVSYSTDRTVKISHQAFDESSRTTIDRTDLSIKIVLTYSDTVKVISNCDTSSSICEESVPLSWFGTWLYVSSNVRVILECYDVAERLSLSLSLFSLSLYLLHTHTHTHTHTYMQLKVRTRTSRFRFDMIIVQVCLRVC
ncbi:hypothetical protein OAV88_01875 [bacterium]|nr:hypothetical protein [bacterium]